MPTACPREVAADRDDQFDALGEGALEGEAGEHCGAQRSGEGPSSWTRASISSRIAQFLGVQAGQLGRGFAASAVAPSTS